MATAFEPYRQKNVLDDIEEIRFQLTFISEAMCQPKGTEYSELALTGCGLMVIHIMHTLDSLIDQLQPKPSNKKETQ